MNYPTRILYVLILLFLLLGSFSGQAQGGDLLIQQYNKGPVLDNVYSRWSIYPGIHLIRINTDQETTTPKLTSGGFLHLEYRVSKTVGFFSGLNYTPIAYTYPVQDSLGQDRLTYLSIPLALRLHPNTKISVALGGTYNIFHQGEKLLRLDDFEAREYYPEGVFKNSFGGVVQVGYHFFNRFYGFVNFRWATKSSSPTQKQTNNTLGFQLGLNVALWRSRIRR